MHVEDVHVSDAASVTKNVFERRLNVCAVDEHISALKANIARTCSSNSGVADTIAHSSALRFGDADFIEPAKDASNIERVCHEMFLSRNTVTITAATFDGSTFSKTITIQPLEDRDEARRVFKRIKEFGTRCVEPLEERFGAPIPVPKAPKMLEPSCGGLLRLHGDAACWRRVQRCASYYVCVGSSQPCATTSEFSADWLVEQARFSDWMKIRTPRRSAHELH